MRKLFSWSWLVLTPIVSPALAAELPLFSWEGQTMGSTYTVKLVDARLSEQELESLKAEMEQRLVEINRQMSHYQPDSELSRFNRTPAHHPFPISTDFARVLRLALELNHSSHGAFEPTLGPVINLWGFGEKADQRQVPSETELQKAFANTGCKHLQLTPDNRLTKDIPGLQLNLSAIAKGFGVDEMTRVLRQHGLTNSYVAISGEVFVSGHNAQGGKWRIGVSAPVSNWRIGDPLSAVLSLSNQAVSTSGDYQKFFLDAQGRRLCHIFDPKTGHPIQHNLGGVSVVAPSCTLADSLATTLFVLGPAEGLRFIEKQTNGAALFIVREAEGEFRQIASSRFTEMSGYKP